MIQKLAENVIQQIAAGEVLERPANLVKELVENAIDAKATFMKVKVGADTRSFHIEDNGVGISKEDLALALERHATSKIHDSSDLWALETFGFRGEALSCIAAVSQLELRSKKRGSDKAYKIVSDFGKNQSAELSSLNEGTHIQIKDLFENVPARLKFLKSENAEFQQIKKVFKTFAFTYPEVHFQLFFGERLDFDLAPQKQRIHRVANLLNLAKMYESQLEKDSVRVKAVFSSPNDVQRTSKNIWFFVQNRWVQDRSLNAAVLSAYDSLLMHGEFPSVAVWIDCDPQEVDVNVHPTKSQVKFREPSKIFRIVRECLRQELLKAPWRLGQELKEEKQEVIQNREENQSLASFQFEATQFATKNWQNEERSEEILNNEEDLSQILNKYKQESPKVDEKVNERQDWEVQPFWSKLQVLGQCNLTYIIAQSERSLFLVDQHAAHERIAYEKLMQSWREGKSEVQTYLFPYNIEMDEDSLKKIMDSKEDLEKLGFQIEKIDNKTLGIQAGPALVKDSAIGKTMNEMAESLLESEDTSQMEKKISHICATIACHSVVRAGQALSNEEMKALLEQMDVYPLSTFCPHGRPVYVEHSFSSLDKAFGRIVT